MGVSEVGAEDEVLVPGALQEETGMAIFFQANNERIRPYVESLHRKVRNDGGGCSAGGAQGSSVPMGADSVPNRRIG